MTFAENLKQLRTKRRLSQNDLAVFLHVSAQTVSRWEKGSAEPDLATLKTLADYFDITLDALLCRMPPHDTDHEDLLAELHKRAKNGGKEEANAYLRALSKEIGEHTAYIARYFSYALSMKRKGLLSDSEMMQVRENVRAVLLPLSNTRRTMCVSPVYMYEEEKYLDYWNDFLSAPVLVLSPGFPPLERSAFTDAPEMFGKKKEEFLYNDLIDMLRLITRESSNGEFVQGDERSFSRVGPPSSLPYRYALALIGLFSNDEKDVFLYDRIRFEMMYMIALAREGEDSECLAVCEDLRRHLKQLVSLKGKKRKGSVPLLEEISEDTDETHIYHRISELTAALHLISESTDAPAVTRDPRFPTEEEINALLKTPDLSEADEDFQMLQKRAEEAIKSAAPADFVRALSVLTEKGNVYDFVVSENGSPLSLEKKLTDALAPLRENKDASIRKAAVASAPYQGTGFAVTPLYSLDPKNADTKILFRERERYAVRTVKEELERRKAFKRKALGGC